jgi:hypothetical protein
VNTKRAREQDKTEGDQDILGTSPSRLFLKDHGGSPLVWSITLIEDRDMNKTLLRAGERIGGEAAEGMLAEKVGQIQWRHFSVDNTCNKRRMA